MLFERMELVLVLVPTKEDFTFLYDNVFLVTYVGLR